MDAAETREDMAVRHKKEVRELENKVRFMLKQAKKPKKAEAEAEAKAMQAALQERHSEEMAAARDPTEPTEECGAEDDGGGEAVGDQESAAETVQSKREKAKRKKDRKAEKEAERLKIKAEILENAGPSMRDLELQDLDRKLNIENFKIHEIAADGNCMYRAVADQLCHSSCDSLLLASSETASFTHLRQAAAQYMRSHREDFEPFINTDDIEESVGGFDDYCDRVASPVAAVWGGQLELRALSAVLQRPIWVYDALQPTVCMGEGDGEPIRLSFHRHFYSLGEHYNSVVSK